MRLSRITWYLSRSAIHPLVTHSSCSIVRMQLKISSLPFSHRLQETDQLQKKKERKGGRKKWWLTGGVEFLLLDGCRRRCRMSLDGCSGWLVTFDTNSLLLLLLLLSPLGRKRSRMAGPGRVAGSGRGQWRHGRRPRWSEDEQRLGARWRTDDPRQIVLDATVHVQWRRIIFFRIDR